MAKGFPQDWRPLKDRLIKVNLKILFARVNKELKYRLPLSKIIVSHKVEPIFHYIENLFYLERGVSDIVRARLRAYETEGAILSIFIYYFPPVIHYDFFGHEVKVQPIEF